jgi:hypothetical protein
MKVRLATIKTAQQGFAAIAQAALPIKVSYAVMKNLKKLVSELEDMEKVRVDLVKKYGVDDGKGIFNVTKENIDTFEKEYAEFLAQEVELDIWKIPFSKISESTVKLTPQQMLELEDFIEDDAPKVSPVVPPPVAPVVEIVK